MEILIITTTKRVINETLRIAGTFDHPHGTARSSCYAFPSSPAPGVLFVVRIAFDMLSVTFEI